MIRTPRLLLRPWRDDDRIPFEQINGDPEVMEHFPAPLTPAESAVLATRIADRIATDGWGLWAVEVAASGRFAGFTGLAIPTFEARFTPCVEVGWRLARWAWGLGYATEAATAALHDGFERLGLEEIVSFTAATNRRSERVMQRLGMRSDGTFEHPRLAAGHRLRTHVLYRLARKDFAPPDW